MSAPATYTVNTYIASGAQSRTAGSMPVAGGGAKKQLQSSTSQEAFKINALKIAPSSNPSKDVQKALHKGAKTAAQINKSAHKDRSWSFWDFLDIINPLHHVPVVGSVYRALSGDELKAPARIAGSTLYGGPIGLATGVASAMIAESNGGKDLGETAIAWMTRDKPADNDVQMAEQMNAITPAGGKQNNRISAADIIWNGPRVSLAAATDAPAAETRAAETPILPHATPVTLSGEQQTTLSDLVTIQEFNLSPLSSASLHTPTPLPSRGTTAMEPATQPHTPTPLPSNAVSTDVSTPGIQAVDTPTALLRAQETLASAATPDASPETDSTAMTMALDRYRAAAGTSTEARPELGFKGLKLKPEFDTILD